jgi:hypothetical protein
LSIPGFFACDALGPGLKSPLPLPSDAVDGGPVDCLRPLGPNGLLFTRSRISLANPSWLISESRLVARESGTLSRMPNNASASCRRVSTACKYLKNVMVSASEEVLVCGREDRVPEEISTHPFGGPRRKLGPDRVHSVGQT